MSKVKSLSDLKKIRDQVQGGIEIREKAENPESKVQVKVAMATCGIAAGSKSIFDFFATQLDRRNIDGIVTQTGCMGYCYAEPTVEITLPGQDPVVYGEVDEKKADEIIEKYIKNGELVDGIIPVNYETIESKDQKEE